jgi:hypothetical protein
MLDQLEEAEPGFVLDGVGYGFLAPPAPTADEFDQQLAIKEAKLAAWREREQRHFRYMRDVVGVPENWLHEYAKLRRVYIADLGDRDRWLWGLEVSFRERFGTHTNTAWEKEAEERGARGLIASYREIWGHQGRCWRRTKKYRRLKPAKLGRGKRVKVGRALP